MPAVPKPGKAAQSHREKHSVDMSQPPDDEPPWERPPPEECERSEPYRIFPDGADGDRDKVVVSLLNHIATDMLVGFALVQQTMYRGKWRNVVVVDTAHDQDVHVHRYSRKTGERVGRPEVLKVINDMADVSDGYDLACDLVRKNWSANRQRWHDA